jgi:flagellar protein FlbD
VVTPWCARNRNATQAPLKPAPNRPIPQVSAMIRLTRFNQQTLVINADVIAYVEPTPDTLVTLTNGERIHVRESVEQVVERVVAYHQRIRGDAPPTGDGVTAGKGS